MRNPTLLARIAAMATGAVLTAALVLAGPAAAGAPTTTPSPASSSTAPATEVGLIPPICATTDPVAFPCADGVPVLLP
ncbi:MAG: hypothetical protein AB7O95_13945 [Geminicoccaceae bacterium]